jgi:hypothetical protein
MKKKINVQIHGEWSLPVVSLIHLPCLCGMACRAKTVLKHVALYSSRRGQSCNP